MKLQEKFNEFIAAGVRAINAVNGGENMFVVNEADGEGLYPDDKVQELPNPYFNPVIGRDEYDYNINDGEVDHDANGLDDFEPDPIHTHNEGVSSDQPGLLEYLATFSNEPFEIFYSNNGGEEISLLVDDSNYYQVLRLMVKQSHDAKESSDLKDREIGLLEYLSKLYKNRLVAQEEAAKEDKEVIDGLRKNNQQLRDDRDTLMADVLSLASENDDLRRSLDIERETIGKFVPFIDMALMMSHKGLFCYHLDPVLRELINGERDVYTEFYRLKEQAIKEAREEDETQNSL